MTENQVQMIDTEQEIKEQHWTAMVEAWTDLQHDQSMNSFRIRNFCSSVTAGTIKLYTSRAEMAWFGYCRIDNAPTVLP